MRSWTIGGVLALAAACGAPELTVELDGRALQTGDRLELPDTRRFGAPASVVLTVANAGTAPADVSLDVPEDLLVSSPLGELGAGESMEVEVALHPDTGVARQVQATLVVLGDDEAVAELDAEGRLTPYIRIVPGSDQGRIREAILGELRSQAVVGAAVAVIEGQDIVYIEGFGFADREAEIEVDPSVHRFRWASLSKGLTALAALTEVEAGTLDLDAPVSDLVADYVVPELVLPDGCLDEGCAEVLDPADRHVSMRRLMSHTAGAQHYTNGTVYPVPPTSLTADPEVNTGMAWALPLWTDAPLVRVPGQAYSYSTFGYNLAGVGVEQAAGVSLGQVVAEVVSPVIEATTLGPDVHWDPAPDRVVGYRLSDGEVVRGGDDDVSWKLAGGGFESTVEDLARYCGGLMGDVIIDPELRDAELWTVQPSAGSYGLGFTIRTRDGVRTATHTGAQQSTRTALWIDRDAERCFVAMTNSTWGDPSAMNDAVRFVWPD